MLATALIVFREILEAALVVGIVMAATKGVPGRGRWVAVGLGCGLLGAGLVAAFAGAIADLAAGTGQEMFNAAVMFLAVGMLGWHSVWMGRHGREMARELSTVGRAVSSGARPPYALAVVTGIAVLREGSEVVLFLYGIAAGDAGQAASMAAGALLGLVGGVAVGLAIYGGLLRIAVSRLFAVTTAMIVLLAAGMAGQGAEFLVQADLLPPLIEPVWNSSELLSDGSIAGKALHTLIGYSAQPSGIQALFYAGTLIAITTLTLVVARRPTRRTGAARQISV